MRTFGSCDVTVGYAFLTKDELPLWPVWERYFEGCPRGSYTVAVHTQAMGEARATLTKSIRAVGGHVVEVEDTVTGDPRFKWSMITAMFRVYRLAAETAAPGSGCTPRWLHLSSESCVPVATCRVVHEHLRKHVGVSFLSPLQPEGAYEHTGGAQPSGYEGLMRKSSQWMTLWADHAMALVADEEKLQASWEGVLTAWYVGQKGFAIDEYLWYPEDRKSVV